MTAVTSSVAMVTKSPSTVWSQLACVAGETIIIIIVLLFAKMPCTIMHKLTFHLYIHTKGHLSSSSGYHTTVLTPHSTVTTTVQTDGGLLSSDIES